MSMDERFLGAAIPDTYDRDRQRLADERRLLLMVARMAADLALWTAHGKRNEALEILALVRQIEGAPGVGGNDGR